MRSPVEAEITSISHTVSAIGSTKVSFSPEWCQLWVFRHCSRPLL